MLTQWMELLIQKKLRTRKMMDCCTNLGRRKVRSMTSDMLSTHLLQGLHIPPAAWECKAIWEPSTELRSWRLWRSVGWCTRTDAIIGNSLFFSERRQKLTGTISSTVRETYISKAGVFSQFFSVTYISYRPWWIGEVFTTDNGTLMSLTSKYPCSLQLWIQAMKDICRESRGWS